MAKLVIEVDDSQAKRSLAAFSDAADKAGVKVKVLSGTLGTTQKETAKLDRQFNRLRSQLDPVYSATQRQERAQTLLNHALRRGTIDQRQYEQLLRRSAETTNRASRGYAAAAASLKSYLVGFASIGFAVQGIRSLITAQTELERIQARLRVAAGGNAGLAGLDFEFVSKKAKELGLNLQSSAQAYSALAVAARGTALEGEGARRIFSGVATASAAMGLSAVDTERALKALEQMISKGVVSMEELRQQLGDVIPGAFQSAARAMGVSTAELNKMVASGEVLATDLLPKLSAEWEKQFGEEAASNTERLTGAVEGLSTAFFELKNALAEFFDFAGMVNTLTADIQRWKVVLDEFSNRDFSLASSGAAGGRDPAGLLDLFRRQWRLATGQSIGRRRQQVSGVIDEEIVGRPAVLGRSPAIEDFIADPAKVKELKKVIKEIDEIHKRIADRQQNLALLAWERTFDPEDTIANMIDIGDRIDYDELKRSLKESLTASWNAAGADLDLSPPPAFEAGASDFDKLLDEVRENFIENFQRGTADIFYDFLNTGELTFSRLWDSFKEIAFRAIAEVAAKLLTLKLAQSFGEGGSESAGGLQSYLKGARTLGRYGKQAVSGAWPMLLVGGAYAYLKSQSDSRNKKLFQSGASVNYGRGGLQVATGASRLSETAGLAAAGIQELLDTLQSSTGLFIEGLDRAVGVSIRNDKKVFQVGERLFDNLQDAVLEAAKQAFLNADLSGALDPALRQYVERFTGDASQLGEGLRYIQDILDQGSGLSALGKQLKGFAAEVAGVYNQLLQLGLDPAEAQRLAGAFGVQGFTDRRRQLTGEQETEAQQRARLEAEAQLYQAELELYRAQLEGRKANLEAQLEIGGAELEIRSKFVEGEFDLFSAEAQGLNEYLGARGRFAGAQAEILKAEIAAISKTLAALANLDISVGDIKIPNVRVSGFGGGGSKRSNLIDRWESAMERLIQAVQDARLGESTTGLTLRERVSTAYADYQALFASAQGGNLSAAEDLPSALRTALELAKEYTGGGTGLDFLGLGDGTFRQFFDLLTAQAEQFALGGRPGKIREGNVVFDRRFHEAQERQITEQQALRQQEGAQLKSVINATNETVVETRETNRLLRKLTANIDRISRVA